MHAASGEDVREGAWIIGVFSGAAIVLIGVVGISWRMCTDAQADGLSGVSSLQSPFFSLLLDRDMYPGRFVFHLHLFLFSYKYLLIFFFF